MNLCSGIIHVGIRKKVKGQRLDTRFVNPQLVLNGEPVDYEKGEYGPQVCADFIGDFIKANKDEPFLVYYPMILAHCPFDPTLDSSDWDPNRPGSTSYKGDQNRPQKHSKAMASYMDKIVGQLEAQLVELGIRDNARLARYCVPACRQSRPRFVGDEFTD